MMRRWAALLVLAALACGPERQGACPPEEPPRTDAIATTVSFRNDVLPVFRTSCTFASCHGPGRPLVLGAKAGASTVDPAAVHAALVGAPSLTVPTMPYVTPGDPTRSFLQRKVDGDLCGLVTSCEGGDCGEAMPPGDTPSEDARLPDTTRNLLRSWILQGAKDDE